MGKQRWTQMWGAEDSTHWNCSMIKKVLLTPEQQSWHHDPHHEAQVHLLRPIWERQCCILNLTDITVCPNRSNFLHSFQEYIHSYLKNKHTSVSPQGWGWGLWVPDPNHGAHVPYMKCQSICIYNSVISSHIPKSSSYLFLFLTGFP